MNLDDFCEKLTQSIMPVVREKVWTGEFELLVAGTLSRNHMEEAERLILTASFREVEDELIKVLSFTDIYEDNDSALGWVIKAMCNVGIRSLRREFGCSDNVTATIFPVEGKR